MTPRILPLFGALLAVALAGATAARAQSLTAKDAWETLHAIITGTGLELRTEGLVRDGSAITARSVVLQSGPAPAAFEMRFDQIRIEPEGEGFALIPSATFQMSTTSQTTAETRSYAFTHDGRLHWTIGPAQLALGLDFPTLTVQQTGASRRGRPLDEALGGVFRNLGGTVALDLSPSLALSGDLTAQRVDYTLAMSDDEVIRIAQTGTSSAEDLRLVLRVTALDQIGTDAPGALRRAFEAGFAARLELASGVSRSDIDQTIGQTRLAMQLVADSSRLAVGLDDGRLGFDTGLSNLELRVQSEEISGQGTLGALTMRAEMPVVTTPEDTEFALRLAFTDLAIDEAVLNRLGLGTLAGDTASFDLNLTALGRWIVEITETPEPAEMPAVFSRIGLETLAARLGTAALTGGGSFTFTPGTFGQGKRPDGTGDFVFELTGGEALLNRLTAAGLIPPDQQFMTRMLMNTFGRAIGPDTLRSEIAIRPGNQITVNGGPLPF